MPRFLSHLQLPWVLLWLGLASLIVLLLVMIRTSWGQSHPLRKCAALSLLAHLLLLCYATTVHIVTAGGGSGHVRMNVTLVDGSDDGTDDPSAVAVDDPLSKEGASSSDSTTAPSEPSSNQSSVQNPTANDLATPIEMATASAATPHPAPPLLEAPKSEPTSPPAPAANQSPDEKTLAKSEDSQSPDSVTDAAAAGDTAPSAAKLPDPAQTTSDSQWVSGEPAAAARTTGSADSNVNASKPTVESAAPPVASRAMPEIYADRMAADRAEIVRRRGGSAESESAVQQALAWLAANQGADGRWDASRFGARQESAPRATTSRRSRRSALERRHRHDRTGALGVSRRRQHASAWNIHRECSAWS